ncbi:hypothetical protein ABMA27_014728 [Loxostege sticticalis]|uniref:Fucosyltransferase n=1 Tax=Loxostege sticticalis TaxID=481309 RepID=A0ABR3I9Z3_LOXSC
MLVQKLSWLSGVHCPVEQFPHSSAKFLQLFVPPVALGSWHWDHELTATRGLCAASRRRRVFISSSLSSGTNSPHRMRRWISACGLTTSVAPTIGDAMACPRSKNGDVGDCPKLKNYLFYLAFENSKCRQYITEKVFHNAFSKGAIPVVMGAPVVDYEKLLPPNSFLHVNSFNSPRELAMEIIHLSTNDDYIKTYHKWRQNFEITNEHGSFGRVTQDLCRLCEALNYNDKATKVYDLDTLRLYLDPKLLCSVKRKNKW